MNEDIKNKNIFYSASDNLQSMCDATFSKAFGHDNKISCVTFFSVS